MTEALDQLAALVLEDGRPWGEAALPFQWQDVNAVLVESARQLRRHFWLRGRGMSKTSDCAALVLVLLLVQAPRRSRSYAYAVDQAQAGLLLDALVGLAERSGLLGALDVGVRSVTVRATGATLTIESSDSASAFGTRPWLVVVDEFGMWGDTENFRRLWTSIISALGKVRASRLLVLSSASSPGSLAHKTWLGAQESEHWQTSCNPGPSPWWSNEDVEATLAELLPAEWRRLILCEFAEADDALTTVEDVAACTGTYQVLEPVRSMRYVMSLDVGTRRDRTVVAVGHLDHSPAGRRVIVDRVFRWSGTRDDPVSLSDVEAAIVATSRQYGRASLVFDPYQAALLTERLKAASVACKEFTFTTASVNRLARSLHGALRDRAIVLPDDPDLADELSTVRLIETGPGLVRLDHRADRHDDQAIAVAMLTATLLDRPIGPIHMEVPQGELRKAPIDRHAYKAPSEPPVAVVAEGEAQPHLKYLRHAEARRHPNFRGSGGR